MIQPAANAGIFFGWKVVAAAFVIAAFTWGIGFYGPSVYLSEIGRVHGWSVTLVSAAFTFNTVCGAIMMFFFLAPLHRRFGVARVTQAGAGLTAAGLLGWALAAEPWQLFAIAPFSGAAWAMTSGVALNAMISPWFDQLRPAALTAVYYGSVAAGVVFSPLWVYGIGTIGFPAAAAIAGVTGLVAVATLAEVFLRPRPADLGLDVDNGASGVRRIPAAGLGLRPLPAHRPWRDRRVVTQAAASALAMFAQIGLFLQLYPLLTPALGASGAGFVISLVNIASLAGRLGPPLIIGPRTNRRLVAILNIAVQFAGSLTLLAASGHSTPLLIAGSVLFGLGVGNLPSLPALIAQGEVPPEDVQRALSEVSGFSQFCFAFAPLAFGALRGIGDSLAQDTLVFATAAMLQLCAAVALLIGMPRHLSVMP